MKEIDARGLACPAPVLQTKAALQEECPKVVKVVVDSAASQQNVQRFFESQGFQTAPDQVGTDYVVIGNCDSMLSVELAWTISA
jgi:TusA-related sulfurtransferase